MVMNTVVGFINRDQERYLFQNIKSKWYDFSRYLSVYP